MAEWSEMTMTESLDFEDLATKAANKFLKDKLKLKPSSFDGLFRPCKSFYSGSVA